MATSATELFPDYAALHPGYACYACFLDSATPLADIRTALAEAGPGRGQIKLIPWLDGAREVEIALPSAWRISGALVDRLRAIPGVRDVREV